MTRDQGIRKRRVLERTMDGEEQGEKFSSRRKAPRKGK